ncbi:MAG: alanine--tRNA ligase [Chloroflexi bacterium]|nr:alanine--tRNA ligase [Chloroflexota bacterium]
MKSDQIRESFLRFFEGHGHKRLPGAPLVPPGDPTLLFTSAGMVQFKPYFMGEAKPAQPRVTTVQKCFRTTDIDAVGDTSHLTFFEMLGNFSFGDYFKAEAIDFAWEYVTGKKWLGLDPSRLWVTVYLDDDEAAELWRKIGLPRERILRYGEEHNYWFAGPVGPCGPDSEIFYDFGEQYGCGPACEPAHGGCARFVEMWNLVFMTYYQQPDGSRTPLPAKNIDTGAGVERLAAVMAFEGGWKNKRAPSVYDTDLFQPIIRRIEELSGRRYGKDPEVDRAMRIVAEHARAVTFLIGDERTPVVPSNEERGYAVRRVLRRAVYFGRRYLGLEEPFLADIVSSAIETMQPAYPELETQRDFVMGIIGPEEQRFEENLRRGLSLEYGLLALRQEIEQALIEPIEQTEQRATSPDDEAIKLLGRLGYVPFDSAKSRLNKMAVTVFVGHRPPEDSPAERWGRVTEGLAIVVVGFMSEKIDQFKDWLRDWISSIQRGKESFRREVLHEKLQELGSSARQISGLEAFMLYDTYGFAIELIREIAAERGFSVDDEGFERLMAEQRERARAAARGGEVAAGTYASLGDIETPFVGYEGLSAETAVVAVLPARGEPVEPRAGTEAARPEPARPEPSRRVEGRAGVDAAEAPAEVEVVLAQTTLYPESGGQVGDRGEIVGRNGVVLVEDTLRAAERIIIHRGRVTEGRIAVGDAVVARVDGEHRQDTMRNHTGTHLLHAALRQVLGTHVRQSGSLVAPDRLRFDFTHPEALSEEQLAAVEQVVNEKVRQNLPVDVRITTFEEAMKEGVLAFFGEKYGDEVRVVEVDSVAPRFSAELCGGTHCQRTGDIGLLVIVDESSIGAGMRRIEALTGRGAVEHVRAQQAALDEIARKLAAPRQGAAAKVESLIAEVDAERKKVERLERALAQASAGKPERRVKQVDVGGVSVLTEEVEATSEQALRFIGDRLKGEIGPTAAAVIGAVIDERLGFLVVVSKGAIEKGVTADALVREVAKVAGGGGGGRPDMATGGGRDPAKLSKALEKAPKVVEKLLRR